MNNNNVKFKWNGLTYENCLLLVDDEIYIERTHCGCMYNWCINHEDIVQSKYSDYEETGDDFWLDFNMGTLERKLHISLIYCFLEQGCLVIKNYEELSPKQWDVLLNYANSIGYALAVLDTENGDYVISL